MNEKKITFELFVTFCKEPVLQVKIMLNQCFFATSSTRMLISAYMCFAFHSHRWHG